MRTHVFIDGFNLYHRVVKPTQTRWLDVRVLCQRLLQAHHQIEKIHYFTAMVSNTRSDPAKATRQDIYIKALEEHIPELTTYFGEFQRHVVRSPLASSRTSHHPEGTKVRPNYRYTLPSKLVGVVKEVFDKHEFWPMVDVIKTEEKGSDVNLAIQLLDRAWKDEFDCAVILSNDADLAGAIDLVRSLGKTVGVLTAQKVPTYELSSRANFHRRIKSRHARNSELPPVLPSGLRKPDQW